MTSASYSQSAADPYSVVLDSLPRVEFDIDAPLPGGLASSGTEPITQNSPPSGGPVPSGTSSVRTTPVRIVPELLESRLTAEEKACMINANALVATPSSMASTVHLSTKSAPGTPASTSTPAQPAGRNLLDYASESFLSAAKSKGTVLSMGTVLPDTVQLATSSSANTTGISFGAVQAAPVTTTASGSGSSMLTPATDSLRSISSILKKEIVDPQLTMAPTQGHSSQLAQGYASESKQPQLPSPPSRHPAPSYQSTPVSRTGHERYINQYEEFVGLKKQQQQQQQQLASPPSAASSSSSISGPKPFDSKKHSPPAAAAAAASSGPQKTNWDLQHLNARCTSGMTSLGTMAALPASSTTSMPHKAPSTQTQVHQVSSSLSKTQGSQLHGHKVNIPGGAVQQGHPAMTSASRHRASPSQSFTSDKQPMQQRQVQGQNLSLNQRSAQSQGQTITSQSRSYQGQSFQQSVRKPASHVGGTSGTVGGGQMSTVTQRPSQGMGIANINRVAPMPKTSPVGGSGMAHSPGKRSMPSSPAAQSPSPGIPLSPQQAYGGGVPRHAPSPSNAGTNYKAAMSKASGATHNGSQGSTTNLSQSTGLAHLLDSGEKKAKANSKAPTPQSATNNDIVYSSLTMAQILASSPADTGKHYSSSPATPTNKSAIDSHLGLWGRSSADHSKSTALPSPGLQSPGLAPTSSPSSSFPMAASVSHTAPTTANVFMPPTSSSLHSGMRLTHASGLQLTPGG